MSHPEVAALRRVGLFVYWATFTILMARSALNPGFVADRQHQPYPWRTVVAYAFAFALVTFWLGRWWNLRFQRRANRIGEVFVFVGLLLFFVLLGLSSDLPGYGHGVTWFAAATTVVLVLRLIASHVRRVQAS
jgi:Kef-type K+ transport system membrane component KefB